MVQEEDGRSQGRRGGVPLPPANGDVVAERRELWAEFRFPPINLWNMAVTTAAANYHASKQDKSLWENYD